MSTNSQYSSKLEKHDTKDVKDDHINGSLVVIWRDWDKIIKNEPKMVYVSSINPGEIKGPHIHTKRSSYFTCVHGEVVFIIKNSIGKYIEVKSSETNPVMVYVPKGLSSAHVNLSKNVSRILTLADVAWKPNDNEMQNQIFDNYDWAKWKK